MKMKEQKKLNQYRSVTVQLARRHVPTRGGTVITYHLLSRQLPSSARPRSGLPPYSHQDPRRFSILLRCAHRDASSRVDAPSVATVVEKRVHGW